MTVLQSTLPIYLMEIKFTWKQVIKYVVRLWRICRAKFYWYGSKNFKTSVTSKWYYDKMGGCFDSITTSVKNCKTSSFKRAVWSIFGLFKGGIPVASPKRGICFSQDRTYLRQHFSLFSRSQFSPKSLLWRWLPL